MNVKEHILAAIRKWLPIMTTSPTTDRTRMGTGRGNQPRDVYRPGMGKV